MSQYRDYCWAVATALVFTATVLTFGWIIKQAVLAVPMATIASAAPAPPHAKLILRWGDIRSGISSICDGPNLVYFGGQNNGISIFVLPNACPISNPPSPLPPKEVEP